MPVRLLTETQAREEWAGILTLARQQRLAFTDLGVMVLRTAVVFLVALPLWRPVFPELSALPYGLALGVAALAFLYARLLQKDLQAARRPGAWLLAASRRMIWLKLRSYRNHDLPADDPVVLAIDREDIRHLLPIRCQDGSPAQLAIVLRQPLDLPLIKAVLERASEVPSGRWSRWYRRGRRIPAPVVLQDNLTTLRVRWAGEVPTLSEVCDRLGLDYPLEAPARISTADARVLTALPEPEEVDMSEVNELLRAGDREGAALRLSELAGSSLEEARETLKQYGWQSGTDPAHPQEQQQPLLDQTEPSSGHADPR